ncbi:MAG: hypothetical protein WCI97_10345 [Bacteroidota bacterium]
MEKLAETENSLLNSFYKDEIIIAAENSAAQPDLRGGFERKILFLTNGEGVPSFNPEIETMFQRMITNLHSNENEIGIIDLKNSPTSFSQLKKFFQPQTIIFCGVKTADIGLQIESEKNQGIQMNDCKILVSDSFAELYKSDAKKKEIFPALKKIFSL